MPELPEVETTVRGLQKEITGRTILDVWTDLNTKDKRKHDTVANPAFFKKFKTQVVGAKIKQVSRRAKNILIHLSDGYTILVHMKMTGRMLITKHDKYVHVLFTLSGGKKLAFSDPRKFGKITLFETNKMHETRHLAGIGPEPLDETFSLEIFKNRITQKTQGKIKTVLMDPSIIAGIGNIYSDEILWRASVHPEKQVKQIDKAEYKAMFHATLELLQKGIDFGGDSMSDYINVYGERGNFQSQHMVYQLKGEACKKKGCKGVIIRKVINGRSAHFCNQHQK